MIKDTKEEHTYKAKGNRTNNDLQRATQKTKY